MFWKKESVIGMTNVKESDGKKAGMFGLMETFFVSTKYLNVQNQRKTMPVSHGSTLSVWGK
jgi:hypothetical protein